jgi:hypothetical protein
MYLKTNTFISNIEQAIMVTESKKVTLSFDVGSKNLAYCLIDDETETILDWNVLDIGAATYDRQCAKLIEALDKIDYSVGHSDSTKQLVTVVIERQLARNPKMRVISGQLQMYYAIEKKACQQNDDNTEIAKILYYSSKYKLKVYKPKSGDAPIVEKKYSTPYAFRKNLGIQHCERMIKWHQKQKWLDLFEKNRKKRDDLADSFLQGIAYMRGI